MTFEEPDFGDEPQGVDRIYPVTPSERFTWAGNAARLLFNAIPWINAIEDHDLSEQVQNCYRKLRHHQAQAASQGGTKL